MSPFQKGTRDQKDNSLASIHHFSDMWSFWRFRTFQPSELCWLGDLYHEKRASSYAHLYSFPGEWRHTGAERSSKLLRWRSASGSWKSFWTRAIESCIYRLSSPWLQVFREICWLNEFLGFLRKKVGGFFPLKVCLFCWEPGAFYVDNVYKSL